MPKSNKDFYEKLRMQNLAGIVKTDKVNESNLSETKTLEEYKRTDGGIAYGIVKENHNYFIKKSNKKGNLNVSDFAYIDGAYNGGKYKYNSLGESQKQLNFVLMSINEAFSLEGVYNKGEEITEPKEVINEKVDANSVLKNAISSGKKNIAETTEKKFKETLNKRDESKSNNKLMNEDATKAIQRALGIINEDTIAESDIVTSDSEIKDADVMTDKKGKEDAQAPINDKNAKSKADAAKATGTKDANKKEGGEGTLSVNQAGDTLKEEVQVTADSELNSDDSLVNHTGDNKEAPQAPINDKNAKAEAEKRNFKSSGGDNVTPDNSPDESTSGEEEVVTEGEGEVFDKNTEGGSKDLITKDTDQKDADRLDNESKVEKGQSASLNQDNPQAQADKNNVGGGDASAKKESDPFDKKKEGGKITESEDEPFEKNPEGGSKDITTKDSDQKDADRIDNETHVEKEQAPYNNHNQPEKGHKEEKGEPLKDKPTKTNVVAEGDVDESAFSDWADDTRTEHPKDNQAQFGNDDDENVTEGEDLITKDSEINPADSPVNDAEGNLNYDEGTLVKGTSRGMDDNAIAEDDMGSLDKDYVRNTQKDISGDRQSMHNMNKAAINDPNPLNNNPLEEVGDADAEIAAAQAAMKNLEINAPQVAEPVAPAPEVGMEAPVDAAPAPEMGMEAPVDAAPAPEMGMEAPVDDSIPEPAIPDGGEEMPVDGMEGGEEGSDAAAAISEYIGKIGHEAQAEEHTPEEVKGWISQLLGSFKNVLGEMIPEDRKEIADKILKAQGGDDEGAIEGGEEAPVEAPVEEPIEAPVEEPVPEAVEVGGNGCDECGGFEKYMESRSYDANDLHECSAMEMGNLISGYANAYKLGLNEGDHKNVATFITKSVANEVKEYGHGDYLQEIVPFHKNLTESDIKFGKVEAIGSQEQNEEPVDESAMGDWIDDTRTEHPKDNQAQFGNDDDDKIEEGNEPFEDKKSNQPNIDKEVVDVVETVMKSKPSVNESKEITKIRSYVKEKLEELAGKRKPSLAENKKSDNLKNLDRLIENQWKLYGKTINEVAKGK